MNVERDLYAIFEINAETVELRGGVKGEGMIEGTMDGSEPEFDDDYPMQSIVMNVIKGESAKLKAKPKEGYMFVCWIDGDTNDIIALEDTIDVKMDEPIYLVAVFDVAGERHRVNVGIGEGFGQLTYTEDGSEPEFGDDHFTSLALSVLEGRTVKLKAKADEGYRFVFWYDEDKKEIIGLEDTLSVEVAKEMNIGAYFDVDVDRIILEVNTEGQGQIAGDERDDDPQFDDDMPFQSLYLRVIPGNTIVLKAKADEGYKFVGWKNAADGKIVSTDATYGVEVNEDMKLTAIFEMIESSNSGNDNSGNSSSNNSNNGAGRATDGTNGSTNTPATGDATSAAALVAITLGSLGTTVMLGKKHRKDEE